MTAITGHWSNYAKAQAFRLMSGRSAVAPTAYTARLYSDNANPDSGTSTELTVAGYVPVPVVFSLNDTALTMKNVAKLSFVGMSAAVIAGMAVSDNGTGHVLWWADFTAINTYPGGGLIIPPLNFIVSMIGI